MEQARRDVILELARAGHKPTAIYKLLNYPKTTVYRVFNAWEAEGKASRSPSRHRRDFLVQVAKNRGVSKQLVSKAVNEDLGYRSYRRPTTHPHGIHEGHQAHQRKRLLHGLKSHGGRIIFFSDEKNWTVDKSYNVQNDRWLAKERDEVPAVFTTKFPASVMTLGVICSTGEERVNAERYCEVMEEVVIPWMKDKAAGREFIFQQDSAPAKHRPQDHQSLQLSRHHILGSEHLALQLAQPQSLEREVCKVSHNSIEALKNSITRACKSFRGRMEKMVAAEGGHTE
ncbi:Uncharacterized protein FKW44_014830 [Caligus rogercresseyi]|uniref:Tc1-like transposase DDE domain-containing protein n=1 Tax=Caligus rogercresseyi TaxID=217165 RepID=A0A7T8H0A9_CALRO|nr:Uncharacterized protein FKW44_014830 [Caligus rogercresseyi]